MSRTVAGGIQTSIDSPHSTVCLLVEMQFGSGTIYVTDAGHDVTWNGNTYTGLGNVGQVEAIKETATAEATGIRFQVAGPLSAYLSIALGEHVQGAPALVYVAFLDANNVVIDAVLEWSGRVDVMTVADAPEQATITVTAESRLADWQRPRVRRHNQEDLQIDYPTDRFYEFVPKMVEAEIVWPAASYFRK